MSEGHSPSRRIVITVVPREDEDPVDILAAVRAGLRDDQVVIAEPVVLDAEPPIFGRHESLETKSRELAAEVLDEKAAKTRKDRVESELKIEEMVQAIVAQRSGTKAYREFLRSKAIRITVDLYETLVGHGKVILDKVMGFFGGER